MNSQTTAVERVMRTLLFASLLSLATVYTCVGFYALVRDVSFSYPVDLRLRWIEQGMIYQGINIQETTYPKDLLPPSHKAQSDMRGSYPPWAYFTSIFLAPPMSWNNLRVYFALVCATAVIGICIWTYRNGERLEPGLGKIACAAAMAAFPICVCLSFGQYSLIVLALLLAALTFLERAMPVAAGLALALAAVKPQLAGLFFLVPFVRPLPRKHWLFAAAAFYLIAASCVIGVMVKGSPLDMLRSMGTESEIYVNISHNPLIIYASTAFGHSMGSKLLAAVSVGVCGLLLFLFNRRGEWLTGFSICAVMSMYWSYRKNYDVLLLVIPLAELLWLWRGRKSILAAAAFLMLGATLWVPLRYDMWQWPAIQWLQTIIWIASLAVILFERKQIAVEASAPGSIKSYAR